MEQIWGKNCNKLFSGAPYLVQNDQGHLVTSSFLPQGHRTRYKIIRGILDPDHPPKFRQWPWDTGHWVWEDPPFYGALRFLCFWETCCQWFGFPLTECIWVQWGWLWWSYLVGTGDDCVRNKYRETKYQLTFCTGYFIMGETDFTTLVWLRHIYETSTSCVWVGDAISTFQGVFPLLLFFNSISTLEIKTIVYSYS